MSNEKKVNKVDEVLKLPGQDVFEHDLQEMLDAEDAEVNPAIIVLLDLDRFLRVNEQFGHAVGDEVLIGVARHMLECAPAEGAKVYRIHGDEFGMIYRGELEKEDIFLLAENMRKTLDVKTPDGENVSISVGIAAAFDNASRLAELVRMAESAMFRAKELGRGRVCLAKEEKMVAKTSHYTGDQLKRLTKLSKREGVGEAILLREAIDMLFKKYDV